MVARKSECHSTSKDLVTRNQKRREATSLTEKKVPSLREVVIEVVAVKAAAEAVAEAVSQEAALQEEVEASSETVAIEGEVVSHEVVPEVDLAVALEEAPEVAAASEVDEVAVAAEVVVVAEAVVALRYDITTHFN